MEHHTLHDDQIKILAVAVDPRILRRELRGMPGVISVTFDLEKNLLFVAGPVDAMELVNFVAEVDRTVHLLPNIKPRKKSGVRIEEIPTDPQYESHKSHDEGHSSNSTSRRHRGKGHERPPPPPPPPRKHREEEFDFYQNHPNQGKDRFKPSRRREKRHDCQRHQGQGNRNHHRKEDADEEEEHKCEAYVPFAFSNRVCRDFYCLKHPPMRDLEGNVPASDDGYSLMRTSPFLGNFGAGGIPYGGYPGMYGMTPPHYGYSHQHPWMLQRPFGFQ